MHGGHRDDECEQVVNERVESPASRHVHNNIKLEANLEKYMNIMHTDCYLLQQQVHKYRVVNPKTHTIETDCKLIGY